MIAVDTSALMAILFNEPEAAACMAALALEDTVVISAGTLAEALIVAERREVHGELTRLIEGLGCDVIAVTATGAQRVSDAYRKWGKGVHPAGLNFGDCFAYAAAKTHGCRLLFVGQDFSRTDVDAVIEDSSGGTARTGVTPRL